MIVEARLRRIGLVAALLLAASAGRANGTVYERNGVIVRAREVDGFPRVSVFVRRGSRERMVYSRYKKDRFLCSVVPWPIPPGGSTKDGLLMTFEYGSGSSRELSIVAPVRGSSWDVVLQATSFGGSFHPLEQVELSGDGLVELITIDNLVFRPGPEGVIDPNRTKVSVWNWNLRAKRYKRTRGVPYGMRLASQKRKSRRR